VRTVIGLKVNKMTHIKVKISKWEEEERNLNAGTKKIFIKL
jgi:hypothetical protein